MAPKKKGKGGGNRTAVEENEFEEKDFQGAERWYEETLSKKNSKISMLTKERDRLKEQIQDEDVKQKGEYDAKKRHFRETQDQIEIEVSGFGSQMFELKATQQLKEALTTEISSLKIEIDQRKKEGNIEINERERGKIYAVKKLSEEMDFKVKETQANLMALNDEQLQTTTRLTILQNHQLTTELDYQSKQTENLLAKNDRMTKQIDALKMNISLHKNIEKQLAKRAFNSQKIIQELKQKAEKLEQEKAGTIRQMQMPRKKFSRGRADSDDPEITGDGTDDEPQLEGEDLINFLESKLESIEKKLVSSQADYEQMQNDCLEIQDKLNFSREKYKRAALLMTEFLEDLLSSKPNILREQSSLMVGLESQNMLLDDDIDQERLQNTPIEELTRDEKVSVMFALLRQLQPYLSANNLTVVAPRRQNIMTNNLMNSLEQSQYHNVSMQSTHQRAGMKYGLNSNRNESRHNAGIYGSLNNSQMHAINHTLPIDKHVDTSLQMQHQQQKKAKQDVSLGNLLTNIKVQQNE